MKNSIFNLIERTSSSQIDSCLERYAAKIGKAIGTEENQISREDLLDNLTKSEEFLFAQLTGKNYEGEELRNLPALPFNEALNSSDASILFPRVYSDVLQEPKEPNLFLSNNVAETIRLADNSPLLLEFPTVDALTAFDMAEGQEYTSQLPSFQQHATSIRISKMGVASAVNEEVITHSMWPIVGMILKMMKNAIDRKVESRLYQAMVGRAQIVFDNEHASTDYHTTGKYLTGTGSAANNGSFSLDDTVKMMGVLLGNRMEPSHMLIHPLAWPIFAQDPIMRAQFYHGGQMGQGIWTKSPAFDQSSNFPFGLQYVPYYALTYDEADTLTGVLSARGASLTTDIYMIDAKNSLFLATRGETEMDQMENWFRDATMLKARKYAGISAKAGGKGMVRAAKVRVVTNEAPLFTVRQLTA